MLIKNRLYKECKASMFDDDVAKEETMKTENLFKIKALGGNVRSFDQNK